MKLMYSVIVVRCVCVHGCASLRVLSVSSGDESGLAGGNSLTP